MDMLKQNNMQSQSNDVFEICSYVDGLEKKLDAMTEELTNVRAQIKEMQEDTILNNLKKSVSEAADRLENRCNIIKEQIFVAKDNILTKASDIVRETKLKGKVALNKVSEFFGVKKKLESILQERDSILSHAKEEAKQMIGSAREKIELELTNLKKQKESLLSEISDLKKQASSIIDAAKERAEHMIMEIHEKSGVLGALKGFIKKEGAVTSQELEEKREKFSEVAVEAIFILGLKPETFEDLLKPEVEEKLEKELEELEKIFVYDEEKARDLGIDTLGRFKHEFSQYKNLLNKPKLYDVWKKEINKEREIR